MKPRLNIHIGPGMQMRHHLADVHDYMQQRPRYISRWGRADVVYNWVGCIIRPRRSYWENGIPAPYGIVIEVGRATWLVALWAAASSPRDYITGHEVDCWHYQELDTMKHDILARRVTDEQLLAFVRSLDESILIPTR